MYVRRYRGGDFEALYALDVACFAPRFRFSRKMMLETVTSPRAVVRLACEDLEHGKEIVLGFGAVNLEEGNGFRFGYLATLDVAPESRGRGVGTALMGAMEVEVVRLGGRWMVLHVYVENMGARFLYERLGYERVGREHGFYGPGHDALLYRKQLAQEPES